MSSLPAALRANPRIGSWVAILPDRRIEIRSGKVELGQGILGALAGIAAAELQVPRDAIEMRAADTAVSPDEGYTAGSLSVVRSGTAIAAACAALRRIVLELAVRQLDAAADELEVIGGTIFRQGEPTGLDYWTMAPHLDMERAVAGSDCAGVSAVAAGRRIDLPAKMRGGAFIHDLAPDDLLHARIIRPIAAAVPDAVLNEAREFARKRGRRVRVLAQGALVAIVGPCEHDVVQAANDIRHLLVADKELPSLDPDHLLDLAATRSETVIPGRQLRKNAARRHTARYLRPFLSHGSIGPSCALARWNEPGTPILHVWTHSQGVFFLRRSLSDALRLEPEAIRVEHVQAAGAYGHNGADDAAADAAFVARLCPGHTIRLLWSRAEEFQAAPWGGASVVDLEADIDADGMPVSWQITVRSPTHSQRPGTPAGWPTLAEKAVTGRADPAVSDVPRGFGWGGLRNADAPYDLPPQRIVHHLVTEPGVRVSALRGLGAHANVFAIECFVDELAHAAGIDPLDYRLRLLSDPRGRAVLLRAAEMAGWMGRSGAEGRRGIGMAYSRYKNAAAHMAMVAEVEIDQEVRLTRAWAAVDAGQLIDPNGALNQIEGGIVQAASWTLREEMRNGTDGRLPSSWADYQVLDFTQIPEIEVTFLEPEGEPPLGLGEAAVGPTAGAIGNAVANALGMRIRRMPFSRDRLAEALLA